MIALGVDASLSCTGLAIATSSGEFFTHRVRSAGRKDMPAGEMALRIAMCRRQISEWALRGQIDVMVIESPSFASTGGMAHERGGLWWAVAADCADARIPIATVAPKTRAIYAVGHGKGKGAEGKKEVKLAVQDRYGDRADIPDDNVADAVVLAAMGMRWLGNPVDELPATHTRAMDSAAWPN